jgi:hypothetical protein
MGVAALVGQRHRGDDITDLSRLRQGARGRHQSRLLPDDADLGADQPARPYHDLLRETLAQAVSASLANSSIGTSLRVLAVAAKQE